MNYVRVAKSSISFYLEPRENFTAFVFQSDYGIYDGSDYESRISTPYGTLCFRGNNDPGLFYYTSSANCDRKLLTTYDISHSTSLDSLKHVASSRAVKLAYDKANHSHPYASSSHSHSEYASSSHSHSSISSGSTAVDCYGGSMYLTSSVVYTNCTFQPSESGVYHCGKYGAYWDFVVANNLCYNSYCGHADGDEEGLTESDISYNFMKQFSKGVDLKQQAINMVSASTNEIQQEDSMQNAVIEKANAIFEYDDEGIELFTNGSILSNTMAQTIEALIDKIEKLETTVADLQNKLGK